MADNRLGRDMVHSNVFGGVVIQSFILFSVYELVVCQSCVTGEVAVTSFFLLIRLKQVPEKRHLDNNISPPGNVPIKYATLASRILVVARVSVQYNKRCEMRCMDVATEIVA